MKRQWPKVEAFHQIAGNLQEPGIRGAQLHMNHHDFIAHDMLLLQAPPLKDHRQTIRRALIGLNSDGRGPGMVFYGRRAGNIRHQRRRLMGSGLFSGKWNSSTLRGGL